MLASSRLGRVIPLAATIAVLAQSTTASGQQNKYKNVAEYLGAMSSYPKKDPPLVSETTQSAVANQPLCRRVSQKEPTDELASFNVNPGILWPGAFVQYRSLGSGTLADVPVNKRKPIVVFVDNVVAPRPGPGQPTLTPETRQSIDIPSASAVGAARTHLLQGQIFTPPNFLWTSQRSYSLQSGLFKTGISANWLSGSVRASLESSSYDRRQNYTVRLTQQFYTYVVEPKPKPVAWFKTGFFGFGGVNILDFTPYSDPETNPITFIRSVTFGRMALLTVSSTEDSALVKKSVEATLGWATGSVIGSLSDEAKTVIQNSEIRLWVYGGGWPSDLAVDPTTGQTSKAIPLASPDKSADLARFLRPSSQSDIIWGLPISYRADYIGSNRPAATLLATEFTICQPPPPLPVRVTLQSATLTFNTTNDDKDDDTYFDASFVSGGGNVASGAFRNKEHFDDNSQHDMGLQVINPIAKDAIVNPSVAVKVVSRNGNDRWNFSVTAHLRWSDGTTSRYDTGAISNNDFSVYVLPGHP